MSSAPWMKWGALSCVFVLAACASPERGTPEYTEWKQEQRREQREEKVDDTVDELPDWFVSPPQKAGMIQAAGTATSYDVQFAIDKALLAAKRQLADRVRNEVSSRLTQYVLESGTEGDVQITEENERITVNVIRNVSVAGYAIENKKIVPFGTHYRAYILLGLFESRMEQEMVREVEKSSTIRDVVGSSSSYEELERKILN